MPRRILLGLLFGVIAYIAGAFIGGFGVTLFSSNTHDRSLEAAMTGAFFFGPIAGLIGFVFAFKKAGTR